MKRQLSLAIGLLMACSIGGCATAPRPLVPATLGVIRDTVDLVLTPDLPAERGVQAILNRNTVSSITRLDVFLLRQDAADLQYKPVHKTTGALLVAGAYADANAMKLSYTSNYATQQVRLNDLKANAKYRVLARAFNGTTLISSDADSTLNVDVVTSERPVITGSLPVRLTNTSFAAATSVTIAPTKTKDLAKVKLSLYKQGESTPIVEQEVLKAGLPKTFTLSSLKAETIYEVRAEGFDGSGASLAVSTDSIAVTNNTTVTAPTLGLLQYAVTTMTSSDSLGVATPWDMSRGPDGSLYVADRTGDLIRKIAPNGTVSTYGTGTFDDPYGLHAANDGSLYVACLGGTDVIKRIAPNNGAVTTLASGLDSPMGMVRDAQGNLFVAEYWGHRIRKIASNGTSTLVAGTAIGSYNQGTGSADGTGSAAQFQNPSRMTQDAAGNLYVLDGNGSRIRKVTPDGQVTTLKQSNGTTNVSAGEGMAFDGEGNLVIAGRQNRIRRIAPNGSEVVIAGSTTSGNLDAIGTAARFDTPVAVCIDSTSGEIFVLDFGNFSIRRLN